ncbi:hypothetical protein [Photobacterium andalusiense]|uniref:Uncharacterized protein n=1 Tax=Photobacterium andalusiense TaxID=2204296 RepID=A0A1Y6MC89_9GAMM|nr:hypothetical protein [Photobacterium andalusiense]SMY33529.1 hypothetical protein PAND9192_01035 [Photobacterium andalusiense]
MTNHIVTTYTRSIFDDDIEEDSIEDFSDEPSSVTVVSFDRAEMLVRVIREGVDLADGKYNTVGEDENRVGYRATLDDKNANNIRFNLVHLIDKESRNLKAYDIEVKAVPKSNKLYISIMPYMPFFTTILDMYDGNEAQQIDALMQQAIDNLAKGWLFQRLMDNNES